MRRSTTQDGRRKTGAELVEELKNFEEIVRYLNPSPGEVPFLAGIEICDLSMPLSHGIGGDHILYIDFNRRYDLESRIAEAKRLRLPRVAEKLELLRHRAGILVADVSGHRMTDALIAAMLHQAFLLGAYYELDAFGEITTKIFEHINSRFHRTTAIHKYFTMIYGEISDEGKFRFISAGHQPPAVFSREYRRFMKIAEDRLVSFPPVGMFPSSADPDDRVHPSLYEYKQSYQVNEINLLASGDILLLCTDGLTEHAGGNYFPQGVERLFAQLRDESAASICENLRKDLLRQGPPHDDVSIVVIRKTG